MDKQININLVLSELKSIADLELLNKHSDKERFSKDFFDYSPILKEKLENCIADIVVRPLTVEAILNVVKTCKRYKIYLTIRGAGTGNYGQCVPLEGGVVMIMSGLKRIRNFDQDTGAVTVESGCLLRDLETELVEHQRQLRLMPSTWRSASIGGFIAGGSGGIGSVRWGFLRDPGHLLGLEIVTLDDNPQKIHLNAEEAEPLNHAYGTNGIITSLTIATAPFCEWYEVIIDVPSFSDAVELLLKCSNAAIHLYLCSLLEKEIVDVLPNWYGEVNNMNRLLMLVSSDGISTLRRFSTLFNAKLSHISIENSKNGKGIRELTWNHTTLHMRSSDQNWTYLQMLLPIPEINFMEQIRQKWKQDILWHLEVVRHQGAQRLAALPIVRWRNKELLEELVSDCKRLDAIIFNPHVITVEDGGLGVVDVDQVNAKKSYDPEGILNPGKLKGWEVK